MKKLYLRFASGLDSKIVGEVGLRPGEKRNIFVSDYGGKLVQASPKYADEGAIIQGYILVPYHTDENPAGKVLLEVTANEEGLEIMPFVDGLKRFWRFKPFMRKVRGKDIKMERFDSYLVSVSVNGVVYGVQMPSNSFTVQPISLLEDRKVDKKSKEFVKEHRYWTK